MLLLVRSCIGMVFVPLAVYPLILEPAVAVHVKVVPGIFEESRTSFELEPVQTDWLNTALLTFGRGLMVIV